MFAPSYLKLLENGELEKRAATLNEMLRNCVLCPHQCQVNRLEGEVGYCKTKAKAIISGAEAHFGEEDELVGSFGSGTIFFSRCNLTCVFCQNYEISHCGMGRETRPEELAQMMLRLQKKKCHNINLVSPSHVIPQIVEAIYIAAQNGLKIPIVYNTNGYDLTDSLLLLEGIIDIYMPDIKIADDGVAQKYLGVKKYYSIATAAVKEMYRQVGSLKTNDDHIAYKGLMIRHLVMPENLASTDKIMEFIANEISKDSYINIMAQYYPAHRSLEFSKLSRRITHTEFLDAIASARAVGLTNIKTH